MTQDLARLSWRFDVFAVGGDFFGVEAWKYGLSPRKY
jgi:hypothetical protein